MALQVEQEQNVLDPVSMSQISTQPVAATQDVDSVFEPSILEENIWGRLLPLQRNIPVTNLIEDHNTFGRGDVSHKFAEPYFNRTLFKTLSKLHFEIRREHFGMEPTVVLEDKSQNGTFVNKALVGKNKKRVLCNNDEIALSNPIYKVFIFYYSLQNDSNEYPSALIEKYTMTKKLGDGTFGEVRLAYTQEFLERVAVKIMKKKILSTNGTTVRFNNISQINNEVQLLRSISHPCIIKLLDIIEGPEKIYVVMELAEGGELFDRISNCGRLNEPITKIFFYQLLHAVSYLHQNKITHRDIKPENILLETEDEYTRVKLTDFGLSKLTQDMSVMTSLCGTPTYIAPELLATVEGGVYNSKVDLWSLGVVLFVCLAGYVPFNGKTLAETNRNIRNARYKFNSVWSEVSKTAKDLIGKLLVVDPEKRYSAGQTLHHPWLQDYEMINTARKLMNSPPQNLKRRRVSSSDSESSNDRTPKIACSVEQNIMKNEATHCI